MVENLYEKCSFHNLFDSRNWALGRSQKFLAMYRNKWDVFFFVECYSVLINPLLTTYLCKNLPTTDIMIWKSRYVYKETKRLTCQLTCQNHLKYWFYFSWDVLEKHKCPDITDKFQEYICMCGGKVLFNCSQIDLKWNKKLLWKIHFKIAVVISLLVYEQCISNYTKLP